MTDRTQAENPADAVRLMKERLERMGMRPTAQRILIARTFFATPGHVDVDSLLRRVRKRDPKVGSATVYRTMRLLAQMGLASERHFGDNRAVYEPTTRRHHHDHMICERCGSIIEFENEEIERLQENMAAQRGFTITRHRLELYGICRACSENKGSREPPFTPVEI